MDKLLLSVKEAALSLVENYQYEVVNVEYDNSMGVKAVSVVLSNPSGTDIDIDDIAKINEELLDIVNDLLPDNYYLQVFSEGIEKELNDNNYEKYIGEYIYVSMYEKHELLKEKEIYGTLLEVLDEDIVVDAIIKTRHKQVNIKKSLVAKAHLAVKF